MRALSKIALNSGAVLGIALGLGSTLMAQSAVPVFREVTHVTILPGRLGDFRAAWKEYNDLLRKAGWDKRTSVWQSATGVNEFRIVTAHNKLAEMDTPIRMDPRMKESAVQLQAINMRIGACIEHSTRVIDQIVADLSLPLAKDPPKLLRVRRVTLRPDKLGEFTALVKSEVMPAVKQSGIATYAYSRVRFGGPGNELYSVTGLSSWADLDDMPPFVKAMGEAKYQAYLAKANTMITRSEVNIYRYQADLSYIPQPATSASR